MRHLIDTFGVVALTVGIAAAFLTTTILAIAAMVACTNQEATMQLRSVANGDAVQSGVAVDSFTDFVRFHYEADWDDIDALEREFGAIR